MGLRFLLCCKGHGISFTSSKYFYYIFKKQRSRQKALKKQNQFNDRQFFNALCPHKNDRLGHQIKLLKSMQNILYRKNVFFLSIQILIVSIRLKQHWTQKATRGDTSPVIKTYCLLVKYRI